MKQGLKLSLAIAVIIPLTGCLGNGTNEGVFTVLGSATGGLVGGEIGKHAGIARPLVVAAMAGVGGLIGQKLGTYLDEQDKQALQTQLSQQLVVPQAQTAVACAKSNTRGFQVVSKPQQGQQAINQSVSNLDCGENNKIVVVTQPAKDTASLSAQGVCRSYKTEILSPQNQRLETVSVQACPDSNGKWKETIV